MALFFVIISYFVPVENTFYFNLNEYWLRGGEVLKIYPGTLPIFLNDLPEDAGIKDFKDKFIPFGFDLTISKDSLSFIKLKIHVGFKLGNLFFYIEPVLKRGNGGGYPSRLWQNFAAGDLWRGYILYKKERWFFLLGREHIKWGTGFPHSFIFSGYEPPRDGFQMGYIGERFMFTFLFTPLEVYPRDTNLYTFEPKVLRYLSAHRIELKINQNIFVGLSESAIFGGESRFPDFAYLNPVFPFYIRSFNRRDVNENILWEADLSYWRGGFGTFFELLVDDFPYKKVRGETPKLGISAGIRIVDFLQVKNSYLVFSYSAAASWTYHHRIPWLNYMTMGEPIGHPFGANFDLFSLYIVKHFGNRRDLFSIFTYLRKGEDDLEEAEPIERNGEFFLEGSIKRRITLETGMKVKTRAGRIALGIGFALTYPYDGEGKGQYLISVKWESP